MPFKIPQVVVICPTAFNISLIIHLSKEAPQIDL